MSLVCWILFGAAYAGWLYLLRERRLPVIVMRAWFTLVLATAVVLTHVACRIIRLFSSKMSLSRSECLCRVAKAAIFKAVFSMNIQHIRHVMMPGSLSMQDSGRASMCMNHVSFFDSLWFLCVVPLRYIANAKTFIKSDLQNLPLFGYALKSAGYFPVYFVSAEASTFTVNKEKQAAVAANVTAFVESGGALDLFPEGAMNRTPETLKDFRLGTFNTILKYRLPLFYIVSYGNHEVWNTSLKGIPGFPADLYIDYQRFEYDAEKMDAPQLATALHAAMQKSLDNILALRRERGYVPWYEPPTKKEN